MPLDKIQQLIDTAFERLEALDGYELRPAQREMAQFIHDCLQNKSNGVLEAPTGVGKSLGALIPVIARAIVNKERTVIATYTNVLAEQYWHKDLPLALSFFEDSAQGLKKELLFGRNRYACFERIKSDEAAQQSKKAHNVLAKWIAETSMGTENEFAVYFRNHGCSMSSSREMWSAISAPAICSQRLCTDYRKCFYYRARRSASAADLVVTNHAVVLTDAEMRYESDGRQSMLDNYHALILDEAHDVFSAAESALEFNLDKHNLDSVAYAASHLIHQLAKTMGDGGAPALSQNLHQLSSELAEKINALSQELQNILNQTDSSCIIAAEPAEILEKPPVARRSRTELMPAFSACAQNISQAVAYFIKQLQQEAVTWSDALPAEIVTIAKETLTSQIWWFNSFTDRLKNALNPKISATWIECGLNDNRSIIASPLDFRDWFEKKIWTASPVIAMSATLVIDDSFDFFLRRSALEGSACKALPNAFDYSNQAVLYLPLQGRLIEPPQSASANEAQRYYQLVAREILHIMKATKGRMLALFTSRKEMEQVKAHIGDTAEYPIYMQGQSGISDLSHQFKEDKQSVLFGLRSFWTGFDAPGETLSCVVLVRIPFEVPIDPRQLAHSALIELKGGNSFMDWSLPNAKQQIRQGAGRLLRREDDKGIICLLDARIYTKKYGREIIANLPRGLPISHNIESAVQQLGL